MMTVIKSLVISGLLCSCVWAVPPLSSRPGALHTIYLDFDGHVTSGTLWNDLYNDGQDFVTPPAVHTDEVILKVWQRVAEDFIPFNINVTTIDPGVEALRKTSDDDEAWGVRVCIGGSGLDWYGLSNSGVGQHGSFNWAVDMPAYCFDPDNLGRERNTAEVISHEVGHTLSCGHDGTSSSVLYGGHGAGETKWAPIMGVPRGSLTQWTNGDYPDSNTTQDELAVITSNGFSYAADAHGIIERSSDVDTYQFEADGPIDISVANIGVGANLDIMARIYDSSGNTVIVANPQEETSVRIQETIPAGTYFIAVSGAGKDATEDDPGYSDYGSLGQYKLTGALFTPIEDTEPPPPDPEPEPDPEPDPDKPGKGKGRGKKPKR